MFSLTTSIVVVVVVVFSDFLSLCYVNIIYKTFLMSIW